MITYTTKKLFTLIFSALILHALSAQQKYQLDSVVNEWTHYETQKQVEQQHYDPVNRTLFWQNDVRNRDGVLDEGVRKIVQYDSSGNEIILTNSYWNTEKNQWLEREKWEKRYDDKNRLTSNTHYEMQRGKWVGMTKSIFEFEQKSTIHTRYRNIGAVWIPIQKNTRLLNENNKEILIFDYQWDHKAGDWLYWKQQENRYERDSLLRESLTYTWNGKSWTNGEKIVCKYLSESDRLTDSVVYVGTDDGWQYKHLTQIKYYKAVRIEETFDWSKEDNDWRADTFNEIYTDQYGRDTDFALFVWNQDSVAHMRHAQGMTVYDFEDRITQIQEIRYENGRIDSGMETLFEFDQDGNLQSQTQRSLNGKRWEVQKKKEFSFNKQIVLRNEHGETSVSDHDHIGQDSPHNNTHALDAIRTYMHLNGEMVLQDEWHYFYSLVEE